MDSKRVVTTLRQIGKIYGGILEPLSVSSVLVDAVASVEASKLDYDVKKRNQVRDKRIIPKPWGYKIDHSVPLRFKKSPVKDVDLIVDVYCDIGWEDNDIPVNQDIKIRIWSEHSDIIYRESMDSELVGLELLETTRQFPGRVISRLHFDKANPDQKSGPEYHLQVGGIPEDYELCWHPKAVNVPRLEYQPMELFLTCQMIAANFFGQDYEEIKRKSEWLYELNLYQEKLLLPHYKKCLDTIVQKKCLLDSLWVN